MAELRLRTTRPQDLPGIRRMNTRIFGRSGMSRWTPGQLEEHVRRFQEGQFVVHLGNRLVASASSLRVPRSQALTQHTWMGITGGGGLSRHDPQGDVLYGIEIMIDPEAQGLGVAPLLYRARKVLARRLDLWGVVLGGRLAGYREARSEAPGLRPAAYLEEVRRGKRADPVVSVQMAAGFTPVLLLPNYIRDPEAMDHAALMIWRTDHGAEDEDEPIEGDGEISLEARRRVRA